MKTKPIRFFYIRLILAVFITITGLRTPSPLDIVFEKFGLIAAGLGILYLFNLFIKLQNEEEHQRRQIQKIHKRRF